MLASAVSHQQNALALAVLLITSRLAYSLQYPHDISPLGEEGSIFSSSIALLTLANSHGQEGPAVEIAAHVLDTIEGI